MRYLLLVRTFVSNNILIVSLSGSCLIVCCRNICLCESFCTSQYARRMSSNNSTIEIFSSSRANISLVLFLESICVFCISLIFFKIFSSFFRSLFPLLFHFYDCLHLLSCIDQYEQEVLIVALNCSLFFLAIPL